MHIKVNEIDLNLNLDKLSQKKNCQQMNCKQNWYGKNSLDANINSCQNINGHFNGDYRTKLSVF